jgi:hypothetical protein
VVSRDPKRLEQRSDPTQSLSVAEPFRDTSSLRLHVTTTGAYGRTGPEVSAGGPIWVEEEFAELAARRTVVT